MASSNRQRGSSSSTTNSDDCATSTTTSHNNLSYRRRVLLLLLSVLGIYCILFMDWESFHGLESLSGNSSNQDRKNNSKKKMVAGSNQPPQQRPSQKPSQIPASSRTPPLMPTESKITESDNIEDQLIQQELELQQLMLEYNQLQDESGEVGDENSTTTNGKATNDSNTTTTTTTTTASTRNDEYCQQLKEMYGFWSQLQCDLWILVIENKNHASVGPSMDMTPYIAQNIPINERFWLSPMEKSQLSSSVNSSLPSASASQSPPTTPDSKENHLLPSSPGYHNIHQQGQLIYHLHLHKCGGTTICKVFQNHIRYRNSTTATATATGTSPNPPGAAKKITKIVNRNDNCNVPSKVWSSKFIYNNYPKHGHQHYSYVGQVRNRNKKMSVSIDINGGGTNATTFNATTGVASNNFGTNPDMAQVYNKIRNFAGWTFIANEGSLEDEPIFTGGNSVGGVAGSSGGSTTPPSPYFHMTMLRDPQSWYLSMYNFEKKIKISSKQKTTPTPPGGSSVRQRPPQPNGSTRTYNNKNKQQKEQQQYKTIDLTTYMKDYWWGKNEYFTRRLCGVSCTASKVVTVQHFVRAKSMLESFDLILILENFTQYANDLFDVKFPTFRFDIPITSTANTSAKNNGNRRRRVKAYPKRRVAVSGGGRGSATTTATKTTTKTNEIYNDNENLYNRHPELSQYELQFIRNHTWMDKVLYEYAKLLFDDQLRHLKLLT